MDNFSHFALMASIGVTLILLWRLNVAVRAQSELSKSMTSQSDSMAHERQETEEIVGQLTQVSEELTQVNEALNLDIEQQRLVLSQVQSDHSALQVKYGELETELLAIMTQKTQLSERLQNEQLEKANVQRRLEIVQEKQMAQEQGWRDLQRELKTLNESNQLYQQAVQAAKSKIQTLEKDKKQLERDLQQALYQVVELEQHQEFSTSSLPPVVDAANSNPTAEPSLPSFS